MTTSDPRKLGLVETGLRPPPPARRRPRGQPPFYAALLEPLGIPLVLDLPHMAGFPNFALSADGEPSERVHLAFIAASEEAVAAFHAAGLAAGGRDNGAPGPRRYGPPGSTYHAAYVLDRAPRTKSVVGNNVEAVFRSFG